jgi:curved DNA-binding protein CbpA
MPTKDALGVFLESLARKSYYEILRISPDAAPVAIKGAFHDFSLLYHPDAYIGSPPEVTAVAQDIFKRGVEAYQCLSRAPMRQRYDRALARGRLRLDGSRPSSKPPPPIACTIETIARTKQGRQFGLKADRLLAIGRLDDARVQLASACQCEPDNAELAERLQILYEALALEPP